MPVSRQQIAARIADSRAMTELVDYFANKLVNFDEFVEGGEFTDIGAAQLVAALERALCGAPAEIERRLLAAGIEMPKGPDDAGA